ncbi:MAG: UbiA family prenyltransferase, partial [Actinomycetes bacterium]
MGLVLACHPAPAAAVTVVAGALAAGAGRGAAGTATTVAAVLAGQLSIGWSNDWLDVRRDVASGRADKPLARGTLSPRVVAVAAGLAALACVPLSIANGVAAGLVHLVAVASAWTYNLGLKATAASFVPYAVSFGLLPSVATLGLPGHPWAPAWATTAGALLGVAAHAANVLPDMDDDLAAGIRGLPHRLGATGARRTAAGLLVLATAVL